MQFWLLFFMIASFNLFVPSRLRRLRFSGWELWHSSTVKLNGRFSWEIISQVVLQLNRNVKILCGFVCQWQQAVSINPGLTQDWLWLPTVAQNIFLWFAKLLWMADRFMSLCKRVVRIVSLILRLRWRWTASAYVRVKNSDSIRSPADIRNRSHEANASIF